MMRAFKIPKELKEMIGVELGPNTYEIERGDILRFAEAIEDPNPLWQDESFAARTEYGSIIAPPTFYAALRTDNLRRIIREKGPHKHVINGGNELEFFEPIRPGDRISVTIKLTDVEPKKSRLGDILTLTIQSVYKNQDDKVVAIGHSKSITY